MHVTKLDVNFISVDLWTCPPHSTAARPPEAYSKEFQRLLEESVSDIAAKFYNLGLQEGIQRGIQAGIKAVSPPCHCNIIEYKFLCVIYGYGFSGR